MKKWALFSLTDKKDSEVLAQSFVEQGLSLLASGGTREYLLSKGFEVTDISEFTGEPERFGGRVKTLHHKVYSSLLLRADLQSDLDEWPQDQYPLQRIVAVACNFYPFEKKAETSKSFDELVEWVDIGGPTMVRAAAKNFKHIWIFTNPSQYSRFIDASVEERSTEKFRAQLSLEAFEYVRQLDELIVKEWKSRLSDEFAQPELEYGENPHQKACFERGEARVLFMGRTSYNNVRDAEAAWRFVNEFDSAAHAAVAVVKHQTLCGAAVGFSKTSLSRVFNWAWEGDPVSRFGGILGFNQIPNAELTERLLKPFIEVLVLPLSPESQEWATKFREQKPRVLVVLVDPTRPAHRKEQWSGFVGKLSQEPDTLLASGECYCSQDKEDFMKKTATWMGACSKSNGLAIVAQDGDGVSFLVGAGQGQPNRVEAFKQLAWPRAKDFIARFPEIAVSKTLLFSDAFLPFPDLVEEMARVGIKKLIQPGGSKNDELVLARAQELGISVEITGRRHFWH